MSFHFHSIQSTICSRNAVPIVWLNCIGPFSIEMIRKEECPWKDPLSKALTRETREKISCRFFLLWPLELFELSQKLDGAPPIWFFINRWCWLSLKVVLAHPLTLNRTDGIIWSLPMPYICDGHGKRWHPGKYPGAPVRERCGKIELGEISRHFLSHGVSDYLSVLRATKFVGVGRGNMSIAL